MRFGAVRSIQTLFCYARGTEGATRAAAGASASAMRSLFILAVLCQVPMPSADKHKAASSAEQLRNPRKTTRQPSGEHLPVSTRTPTAERASKFGRAPAAPGTRGPRSAASPHAIAAAWATYAGPGALLKATKTTRYLTTPHPPPSRETTARRRPRTAPRPPGTEEPGRRSRACPLSLLRFL